MSSKFQVSLGRILNFPARLVQNAFRRGLGIGHFESDCESMRYRRGPGIQEVVLIREIVEWRHVSEMAVDDIVLRLANGSAFVWDDRDGRIMRHLLACAPEKFVDQE
jgi:hypothetical protein